MEGSAPSQTFAYIIVLVSVALILSKSRSDLGIYTVPMDHVLEKEKKPRSHFKRGRNMLLNLFSLRQCISWSPHFIVNVNQLTNTGIETSEATTITFSSPCQSESPGLIFQPRHSFSSFYFLLLLFSGPLQFEESNHAKDLHPQFTSADLAFIAPFGNMLHIQPIKPSACNSENLKRSYACKVLPRFTYTYNSLRFSQRMRWRVDDLLSCMTGKKTDEG